MDFLQPEVVKIIGPSSSRSWSQVHIFYPKKKKQKQGRGDLFSFFFLKAQTLASPSDLVSFGKEIVSRFHEEYFGSLKEAPAIRLKLSLAKISQELPLDISLEAGAVATINSQIFIAIQGRGAALLKRGKKLAYICKGKEDSLNFSRGQIQKDDIIFLACSDLFRQLPWSTIEKTLENHSPDQIAASLTPLVYEKPSLVAAVALIAKFSPLKDSKFTRPKIWLTKLRLKMPPFIRHLFYRLRTLFQKIRHPRNVFLKEPPAPQVPASKKKKTALTIAWVLIFLFFTSLFLGFKEKNATQKEKDRQVLAEEINFRLREGQDLAQLNSQRSQQVLSEAKILVNSWRQKKYPQVQASFWEEEISRLLTLSIREFSVDNLELFYDLHLLKPESEAQKIALSGTTAYLLDRQLGIVFSLDLEKKSGKILAASDDFRYASALTAWGNRVYLLTDQGVASIEGEKTLLPLKKDPNWQQVNLLAIYESYLYLFDQGTGQLYRYSALENGEFGGKKDWLKSAPSVNLPVSLAIDGSAWFLEKEGKIKKFSGGQEESFNPVNLKNNLTGFNKIFTDKETNNLYLYSSDQGKLIILEKNGNYQSTYFGPSLKGKTDFVVLESAKKAFFLDKEKIFSFQLK